MQFPPDSQLPLNLLELNYYVTTEPSAQFQKKVAAFFSAATVPHVDGGKFLT